MTNNLNAVFGKNSDIIIGMVHLQALPGSPGFSGDLKSIYRQAIEEAKLLEKVGFDGIIVENFNDTPYCPNQTPLATVCSMAGIVNTLRDNLDIPIGVNVQFNDVQAELAIAQTCGADFIRVEVFVENVMTPQGKIPASSAFVMRMVSDFGLKRPLILADIRSKGTTPLNPDKDYCELAHQAEKAGADAVILTGAATGKSTPLELVSQVRKEINIPAFIGSGVNHDTIDESLATASGVIVGSATKYEGEASNKV
ncbi:MAG: BtpA/SgcQ family protein, partial [Bacillota bacterium]